MILREIVHTCSNAHVARAALASIGGEFAARFAEKAYRKNLPPGVLAAKIVKEFSRRAADEDWEAIDEATRGVDHPILEGFRAILDQGLNVRCDASGDLHPPAWVINAIKAQASAA